MQFVLMFWLSKNVFQTGPDAQPWTDAGEMHADGALPGDDRAGSGRGARHGRPRRTPYVIYFSFLAYCNFLDRVTNTFLYGSGSGFPVIYDRV
jgi:hypothetical protein